MKNIHKLSASILLSILSISFANAQSESKPDSLGLPGDNLNLFAVMKLFQESETLEGFEKKLNDKDNKINNLDLNQDNEVDYIRVIDKPDGSIHNIVLQVPVNETENQDVAVFIVEKDKNDKVNVQLIGDESLYGKNYIIEPEDKNTATASKTTETPNPGYVKKSTTKKVDSNGNTTIINNYYEASTWPVVKYVFMPTYTVWVSPWHWRHYPVYWVTWTPWYWHQYYVFHYPRHYIYHRHFRYCNFYRNPAAVNVYIGFRSSSVYFHERRNAGDFQRTYGRPEIRYNRYPNSGNNNFQGRKPSGNKPAKNSSETGNVQYKRKEINKNSEYNNYNNKRKYNSPQRNGSNREGKIKREMRSKNR